MNLSTSILLYQQLHSLVNSAKTGNPNELSIKLDISVSCLYAILKTLNDNNIQIAYCRQKNSYIYLTDTKIQTGFTSIDDSNYGAPQIQDR
jgi:ribosomal protein S25